MTDHIPVLRSVAKRISLLTALGASALFSSPSLPAAPSDFTVESPVDGETFKLSDAKGRLEQRRSQPDGQSRRQLEENRR